MAGASAPSLSIAVANAGGLGSCGVLLMRLEEIIAWANDVRANSNGAFQLNNWIPDPPPRRDRAHEAARARSSCRLGPPVPLDAGDATPLDFAAQCEAMLEAGPATISSIMGLYPREFVARLRERGITWFATASTVSEARAAEAAGADVIVAQGSEAGGHRGCFGAAAAERQQVGVRAAAGDCGRRSVAGGCDGRYCRRARDSGGAPPRRERSADRHGFSSLPRSRDQPGLANAS